MRSRIVVVACLMILSSWIPAEAQFPGKKALKYKKGDKVQVEWGAKLYDGEVISVNPVGLYQVSFQLNGMAFKPTLPPQFIKPPKGGKPKPGSAKPKPGSSIPGTAPSRARPGMTKSADGLTIKPADWSKVREVKVDETAAWTANIEAGPAAPRRLASKPILLKRSGTDRFAMATQLFDSLLFAQGSATAFAFVRDPLPGRPVGIDLYRCDLSAGTCAAALRVPAAVKPVAIDGLGQRMLTTADPLAPPSPGAAGMPPVCRVDLWRIGAKAAEYAGSWNPDQSERGIAPAPIFAGFAGSKGVLTTVLTGETTFWNPETAQAIYTVKVFPGNIPGVSPGGRHVAVPVNRSVYVLDAESGRTMGKLPGTVSPNTVLSFRPDGTQLAAVSSQQVQVWNLKTGKLHRDIYLAERLPGARFSVDWVADGYVLVAGNHLIDIGRRILLWQYGRGAGAHLPGTVGVAAGKFWYGLTSRDRTAMGIFQATLPHAAARSVAAALKEDDLLAVKPGSAINLRIKVTGTAQEQDTVRNAITKSIRESGITVSSRARVLLEASSEPGESRKVTYRGFGSGEETITATPQICRLKITESGRTLWEASHVRDVPTFLSLKKGQTAQQAVAAQQKPDFSFFSRVQVPKYVTRPNEKGAYGESVLTPKGIQ